MGKTYKITYKTYFNTRLKQGDFHGMETYPLYAQVTYRQQTLFFKSSMFDLFSEKRFGQLQGKKYKAPSLDFVSAKEDTVLGYTVEQLRDDFSLDSFKESYKYCGTDLCTSTGEALRVSMALNMALKGESNFWRALAAGSEQYILYDVLNEAKRLFKPEVYETLQSELEQAPPYMELFGFMRQYKKWPDQVLTVMEWEDRKTQQAFSEYMNANYPERDVQATIASVERWLKNIQHSLTL